MAKLRTSLRILVSTALLVKRMFVFFALVLIAVSAYQILLDGILTDHHAILSLLLAWLLTAYIVLPRIHRKLTKIYLPDYFIGRVRTGDGLLGDPVNIAVNGSKRSLLQAMQQSGWTRADELNQRSTLRMISSSVFKKSYPSAPVSSLYLFGNKQDLAFQIEVNNNPHARHHVRFWKSPKNWYLPGGSTADWLGAATYDRRVGLSLFTGQITHKIALDTDEERDFVGKTISKSTGVSIELKPHFMSAYRDRNGGGDSIETDGGLLVITFK